MEDDLVLSEKEMISILTDPLHPPAEKFSPVQASDEIVTLFCMLHGGIEVAMPMIRNQFFKSGVDFDHPTRDGLIKVCKGLGETTAFLKGKRIADLEKKRFAVVLRWTRS